MGHSVLRRRAGVVVAALGFAWGCAGALAQEIVHDIYYTRFDIQPPSVVPPDINGYNVKKASLHYNRAAGTFTVDNYQGIARTLGADGIIFGPPITDQKLYIGGQDNGLVHEIGGLDTMAYPIITKSCGTGHSFHLTLDPNGTRLWTSDMPGQLGEVPISPFADGTLHTVTGDDTKVTQVLWVPYPTSNPGTWFYTASPYVGFGNFGTINMSTFVTTRLQSNVEWAHGMRYDELTGHIIACGASRIAQINPANPTTTVATRSVAGEFITGDPTYTFCDQLAVSGKGSQGNNPPYGDKGLIYIASNDGTLFLLDYASTLNISTATFKKLFLDTFLDDVAPVVGFGAPCPGGICEGACCVGNVCSITLEALCTESNGTWFGPGSICLPGICNPNCCPLGTGAYDQQGSQSSQIPDASCHENFAFQAADDFYLLPGNIYRISTIEATMATDQTVPLLQKAGVSIFEDCDGKPGAEIPFTYYNGNPPPVPFDDRPVITVIPTGQPYNATLNLVTVRATFPNLWLRGGKRYWVSFYGTNCADTQWAWVTAGNGVVQGRPAHFRSYTGAPPFSAWASLDECCIGCTDLSFCVGAEECKILLDNGTYAVPSASPLSGAKSLENPGLPAFLAKAADDFVVPPCDPKEICYIEAYILTNCLYARLDIYDGTCELPASANPIHTLTPKRYVHTGQFITYEGQQLEVICLQFWGDNTVLQGGRNYWLSVYGYGNGNINQRAVFAYNSKRPCPEECLIHFSQGALIGPVYNTITWKHVSDVLPAVGPKDFAFMIAVHDPDTRPGNADPSCAADADRSGTVTIDDIFVYLNAWFAGCP